jgi:hypothetical protein
MTWRKIRYSSRTATTDDHAPTTTVQRCHRSPPWMASSAPTDCAMACRGRPVRFGRAPQGQGCIPVSPGPPRALDDARSDQ